MPTTGSKPHAVADLRRTWRRTTEHFAEQLKRFVRLTVLAAMPSLVNLLQGGHFDRKTLIAFILPFAEVAYREVFPALGAAAADSAPGMTIVPEQTGSAPVPVAPSFTTNGGAGYITVNTTTNAPGPVDPTVPVDDTPLDLDSIPADLEPGAVA